MSKVTPDYAASVEFLQKWLPGGPWVLVSIDPNKKGLEAGTFGSAEPSELDAWLKEQGTRLKRNIYFTVNPCIRALRTKPSREHIGSLSWLHVDLDPRAGEDIDEERARILGLLRDPSAASIPPPTAIVFSGGGYQGFWRLKAPRLLDGTAEDYEDAKRYNKQLELLLGGDNCHNVDRIMRLPGTVNRPDKRKRAKGRVEVLAELIEFDDTLHDLAKFTKAPEVQGSAPGLSGGTVAVSGNVARFSSVDEIAELKGKEWNQTRVVIVQGIDPDDPDKFGQSRSEWLFFACCSMVRAGCSDDTVYSVITDPDFGISASVLDKGSGIEEYAIRQIERAKEDAVDPMLREFNDRHAIIGSIGSKGLCRILGEEWEPVQGRKRVCLQTKTDFQLRYLNRTVDWVNSEGKPASMPASDWWLKHPLRRQFDSIVFAPAQTTPGAYNLWKGFAVDADPRGSFKLYDEHVRRNICDGNEEHYDYLIRWMAYCVQNPAQPGQVAVVLRGDQGTGKGVFAFHFGKLWGRHYLQVVDSKHLTGSFNAHMRDCVVMYADEAFASDDTRAEALLKSIVTESTIVTEAKGVDAEPTPNYIHLIMASNSKWVIPAAAFERRYFVLDVAAAKRQDSTYFRAIHEEMEEGGYEALLAHLLALDLSDFNVRSKPDTKGLRDQQEYSLTPEEEWWYSKLCDRELIPGEEWPEMIYTETLLHDYTIQLQAQRGAQRISSYRLKKFLGAVLGYEPKKVQLKSPEPLTVRYRDGTYREMARPYVYNLPDLSTCRSLWAAAGRPANWPDKVEEQDITDVYKEQE